MSSVIDKIFADAEEREARVIVHRLDDTHYHGDHVILYPDGTAQWKHPKKDWEKMLPSKAHGFVQEDNKENFWTARVEPVRPDDRLDYDFKWGLIESPLDFQGNLNYFLYQPDEKCWFEVGFLPLTSPHTARDAEQPTEPKLPSDYTPPWDYEAACKENGLAFELVRITEQPADTITLKSDGTVWVLGEGPSGLPEPIPLTDGKLVQAGETQYQLYNKTKTGSQYSVWTGDPSSSNPHLTWVFKDSDVAWYILTFQKILKPIDYKKVAQEQGLLYETKSARRTPDILSLRNDGCVLHQTESGESEVFRNGQDITRADASGTEFAFVYHELDATTQLEMYVIENDSSLFIGLYEFSKDERDWIAVYFNEDLLPDFSTPPSGLATTSSPAPPPNAGLQTPNVDQWTAQGEQYDGSKVHREFNRKPFNWGAWAQPNNFKLKPKHIGDNQPFPDFELHKDGRVTYVQGNQSFNLDSNVFYTLNKGHNTLEKSFMWWEKSEAVRGFELWTTQGFNGDKNVPTYGFVYLQPDWTQISFEANIEGHTEDVTGSGKGNTDEGPKDTWTIQPIDFGGQQYDFIIDEAQYLQSFHEKGQLYHQVYLERVNRTMNYEATRGYDFMQRGDPILIGLVAPVLANESYYPVAFLTYEKYKWQNGKVTHAFSLLNDLAIYLMGGDTEFDYGQRYQKRRGEIVVQKFHQWPSSKRSEYFYRLHYNAAYALYRYGKYTDQESKEWAKFWTDFWYTELLPKSFRRFGNKTPQPTWRKQDIIRNHRRG